MDERLLEWVDRIGPFGIGNPTPVWGLRGVRLAGPPQVLKGKTLKMQVAGGTAKLDAIAFGQGERAVPSGPIDIAFQLVRNTYRGRKSLQLKVQDFRAAE